MKKDEIKNLITITLLIIILFFAFFKTNIINRQILSIIMIIYASIICILLKKRNIDSIYKKQVNILLIIFSFVYLALFYLLGLYFGFIKSKVLLSTWSLLRFIIPLTIIIITSEMIRYKFLSQNICIRIKDKKKNLSPLLTYIAMVLVDLLIYTGVYDLTNINDFLMAIGFVLFASLSCNLLYNYISIRYGYTGIIVYRLITVLYAYFIPITPDVYIFLRSFIRMLYPYIIYLIIEKYFANYDFVISRSTKKKEVIGNTILIAVITLIIMLTSCQFKYGILVVGSSSMTGSLNKGDAIIYESYDNQMIQKGHVLLFNYNDVQTIHRVVEIKEVNGQIRYYTKGDSNLSLDDDYRTKKDIIGISRIRLKYIGYPTLLLRELFNK